MDMLSFLHTVNDDYSSVIGAGTGILAALIGLTNLNHLRTDSKNRSRPYVFVEPVPGLHGDGRDRKSTRLNSSHVSISYAVFCLKKKKVPMLLQKADPNKRNSSMWLFKNYPEKTTMQNKPNCCKCD